MRNELTCFMNDGMRNELTCFHLVSNACIVCHVARQKKGRFSLPGSERLRSPPRRSMKLSTRSRYVGLKVTCLMDWMPQQRRRGPSRGARLARRAQEAPRAQRAEHAPQARAHRTALLGERDVRRLPLEHERALRAHDGGPVGAPPRMLAKEDIARVLLDGNAEARRPTLNGTDSALLAAAYPGAALPAPPPTAVA